MIALIRPIFTNGLALAATRLTLDGFKSGLDDILRAADAGQSFEPLRQNYMTLLDEAGRNAEICEIVSGNYFSSPEHIHSVRDLRSWVVNLLSELEGTAAPESQNAAQWTMILNELSPRAADLASQSARRVSDIPRARSSDRHNPKKKP